jgi:hypothetical protein
VLHLDVAITVVLSILIATSTMLNWLLEPRKRFMHLLLVQLVLLFTIMGSWFLIQLSKPT